MNLFALIAQIFKPAAQLVDDLTTSVEEKLTLKAKMLEVQTEFLGKALDFETGALAARAKLIEAEAKSEHVITAIWRPVTMLATMLAFVAAILAYWFGLTPDSVPEDAVLAMFSLVKIGLGGYVVGRSAEKVVPGIIKAMKKKEET